MKSIFTAALVLTAICSGFKATSQHAFLDQPLLEALAEAEPNQLISIAITLEEAVDFASLKADFDEKNISAKERAPLVEKALKEKAASTQHDILDFIQNANMDYSSIQTFWIANSIALKADYELVMALANRDDVAYMILNRKAFGYKPKELKGEGAGKSEGGIEPGLAAIGAPEMWAMGYTGHGRIAMTYDTGVWSDHPSHQKRFLANRMPLQSTWYAYDSPLPIDKPSSHGTHVTGTMLGLDTATNDTIGMAPRAYFIATDPVVSDLADVKPLTDFMFGYEWSLNPDGDLETTEDIPDVINNSWGFGPTLDEAPCPEFVVPVFSALEAAGIANVFSAGNEGPGVMTMSVPHNTNTGLVNSFTVGATSSAGSFPIADFSSRGPSFCGGEGSILIKPEVAAPGINVRSSVSNGGYDIYSGTSMAAPHVSGAVLLLREAFPDVTGEEILLAIYNSAIDLGEVGEDNTYGMGMVNVKNAFDLLSETNTPTPPSVLTTDVELVKIISPTNAIACSNGTGSVSPLLEIKNNGTTALENLSLVASIVGTTEVLPVEIELTLEPGATTEIQLAQLNYTNTGLIELYVKIEPIEGEYDVLNNHGVYRFIEIPKYDWDVEGDFQDDFSDGIDTDLWTIYNPDATVTWDTLNVLQADGSQGLAAYMNLPDYLLIESQKDHLISPLIQNSPTAVNSMAFDYFYRKRSNSDFTKDTLVVFINRNCGDEYMSEELLRLGGDELWTNDDNQADALPETIDDWRTVNLVLDLEESNPFFFSFVTLNRRGNNLLIDNVRMGTDLKIKELASNLAVRIYPNPSPNNFSVEWNETGRADITIYDLSGRLVYSKKNLANGDIISDFSMSKGAYVIEIAVGEKVTSQKLIVN